MNNTNNIQIGFQVILVLVIITLLVLSFPAYSNDYPALGTICVSAAFVIIFGWILLAGYTGWLVWVLLVVTLAVGVIAYLAGGLEDWQRLAISSTRPINVKFLEMIAKNVL